MIEGDFIKICLDQVQLGYKILDLGAGEGVYSHLFAEKGALVTAVDGIIVPPTEGSITGKKVKVENFVVQDHDMYDLIFMKNILQFLDKHWVFEILFPWLAEHLNRGGVIGIETFYQEPDPPFDHPLRSLYTMEELSEYFIMWQELYTKMHDHMGLDMKGNRRHFFTSDLIVRKI